MAIKETQRLAVDPYCLAESHHLSPQHQKVLSDQNIILKIKLQKEL
jgi:hypothetical protein